MTPDDNGESRYCQTEPRIAADGTPRKKNSDRTKELPKNFVLTMTARGIARSVISALEAAANTIVNERPFKRLGSLNTSV